MSRIPQSVGLRGSLRWIQKMVEHHPAVLDAAIGLGPITWKSPLAGDEWAEYRDEDALRLVGAIPTRRCLDEFWPARGPQWDALGRTVEGEAVLVEAKAHIAETFSAACQATGASLELITRSLAETAEALGAKPGLDWTKRFYQYANRLAMGHFLNTLNGIPSRVVFVYFIGDVEMGGPSSRAEWNAALEVLHEALGIRSAMPAYVRDAFVDVRGEVPFVA